jgi:uncharacterized protein YeeX (DUF496 family)
MREIRDEVGVEIFEKVMKTHLIPIDENSGLWNDNYDRFLIKRAEMLFSEVRRRCGISDGVSEEHRNPVIDAIEDTMRERIHASLSNTYGLGYWSSKIPKSVLAKVDERIDNYIKKNPGIGKKQFDDPRSKLSFCDVLDYQKVITENWGDFSSMFRSTSELQRNIEDFNAFRNAVKHNRNIDSLLEYRAKAASIWLSRALELDLTRFDIIS